MSDYYESLKWGFSVYALTSSWVITKLSAAGPGPTLQPVQLGRAAQSVDCAA